jgi:hypothetical protein
MQAVFEMTASTGRKDQTKMTVNCEPETYRYRIKDKSAGQ